MSFLTVNSKGKIRPSITGSSAIAYFARRQECLRESIYHIALRNILEKRSDQHYIKNGLGGALGNRADAVNQYKNSNTNGRKSWKISRSRIKLCIELPRSPACAVNCRGWKVLGPMLPRSTANLVATILEVDWILITPYLVIATYMNRGILLNVRR